MRKLAVMATFFLVGVASAMTPQQAVEVLRQVTEAVPVKAADHRKIEAAFQALANVIATSEKKKEEKK